MSLPSWARAESPSHADSRHAYTGRVLRVEVQSLASRRAQPNRIPHSPSAAVPAATGFPSACAFLRSALWLMTVSLCPTAVSLPGAADALSGRPASGPPIWRGLASESSQRGAFAVPLVLHYQFPLSAPGGS